MAELEPKEKEDVVDRHLGRAWRAFTPDAALRDRVRARLTSSGAATLGSVGLGMAANARPEGTWASLSSTSKLGAALVGAALLGIGLLAGYFIRDGREAPSATWAQPSNPVAEWTQSGEPARAQPEAEPLLLPPARSALTPTPAAPTTREPTTSVPRAATRRGSSPDSGHPGARGPTHADATPQPNDELALLRRAERAVRADNAALALALIGELETHYPRSILLEERRALELLAHCLAGATDARARAQRFLGEHPHSVYAGRIDEKCAQSAALSPPSN